MLDTVRCDSDVLTLLETSSALVDWRGDSRAALQVVSGCWQALFCVDSGRRYCSEAAVCETDNLRLSRRLD